LQKDILPLIRRIFDMGVFKLYVLTVLYGIELVYKKRKRGGKSGKGEPDRRKCGK